MNGNEYNRSIFSKPDIFEPGTMFTENIKNKFGTQVLYIYQNNPIISVNVADMTHPYQNLQNDPLIKYQVQYFDFPTNNIVLYKGETIFLYAYITFINKTVGQVAGSTDTDQVAHVGMSPDNYIGFPFIAPNDMIACSEEFAEFIRQCMKGLTTYIQYKLAAGSSDLRYRQMAYALRMTNTFIFDNSTSKFGFVFTVDSSTYLGTVPEYTDANIDNVGSFELYNITYYLRVDPTLTSVRQQRIYRMLGGNMKTPDIVEINDTENEVYVTCHQISFNQSFSFGNGSKLQENGNYWQQGFWALANQFNGRAYMQTQVAQPCANPDYFANSMTGIASAITYSPQVASIIPSDFVYVRTSANTSCWDISSGKRSDLIAILPWSKGFGNVPAFGENILQTEVYGAVETLTTVKSMSIFLTDQQGQLLQFEEPFTLKLAVIPI